MTALSELHPIARELLDAYASHLYFQSKRLTAIIADRNPSRCVSWALNLVEPAILDSKPPQLIVDTLAQVRSAVEELKPSRLPVLDDLSSQCWCHESFDESSPFLQRAAARLGWAALLLICELTDTEYESKFTGIHVSAVSNGQLREMSNQCAMAVDMLYTDTNDGRLMVASAFTREMNDEL